ncbi:MAG TPA: hypothetical protein VFP68_10265 [Burkholderiaceae bacterium]|nr:hypothetical protein [Burkholderiaceae bacterium]
MKDQLFLRILTVLAVLASLPFAARAEPYLAVGQGFKCVACHVNPTGGGLRNALGIAFARTTIPAHQLPADAPMWTGGIGDFLRLGGDLRHDWSRTKVTGQPVQSGWDLQEFRLYGDLSVLPNRLGIHVDQLMAPGSSQSREAYMRLSTSDGTWGLKGGKFYLPFGWRLQDQSAFVRQVTGISMTTPDTGIEAGLELPEWSAQLALTNGTANAGKGSGHQLTGQAVWVHPMGRIGLAASSTQSNSGDRRMAGVFGGLHTGPLVWLGEVDLVRDEGFPEGARKLLAGLGEVNWGLRRGHNLKLTLEYFDPDRKVREDQKGRVSLVYELTPLPFVQLRLGFRRWNGIPQNALDNRKLLFLELHAFM